MHTHQLAGATRTLIAIAAFTLCSNAAQAVSQSDVTFGPLIGVSANVTEALGPGFGTVLFDQTRSFTTPEPAPFQSAELLHLSDLGGNGSGRSTQITQAFGSALAQNDNEGGVGVSMQTENGLGGVVHRMTAEALFSRTANYHGTEDATLKLEVHIPILEVGLLGVAPFTSAPRATETAQATVELETDILRADGTHESGPFFQFGAIMTETQIELGPNTFSNFVDVKPLFANAGDGPFIVRPDTANNRFSFDAVTLAPTLGVLHPGDSVTYVYSLKAIETTAGGEGKGGFAFIGDPFNVIGGGDNLVPLLSPVAAVPEPASASMLLAGLLWVGWFRLGRGRRCQ